MTRFIVLAFVLSSTFSYSQKTDDQWVFSRVKELGTRGGTSQGVEVQINKQTVNKWQEVQEGGISEFERDRRAILALQGEFKAQFEFMETIALDTNLELDVPYHSWGTEFVKLVEDRGDYISLQHILVMSFKDKDSGKIVGPYVVKHWRQDWTWKAKEMLVYQGENHWKLEKVRRSQSKGKWLWTVYQVDDTPRYSALGQWNHLSSASNFSSQMFSRPLPRREFSVRSDYKLLLGKDDLILTKNAWFHEQKNFKHVNKLGEESSAKSSPLLSREIGHNSYKRVQGYDFSIGYDYWEKTSPYWQDVREVWREIHREQKDYKLKKKHDGKSLVMTHFKNAKDEKVLALDSTKRKEFILNLIKSFMK